MNNPKEMNQNIVYSIHLTKTTSQFAWNETYTGQNEFSLIK